MAVNAVTIAQLEGLYKQAYPDGILSLIPDIAKLAKLVKFDERARVGDKYHQPVILTREGGVTYAKSGAGAYALKGAKPMASKDAQIDGSQVTVRSQLALDTVARSMGSAKAFKNATVPVFESNLETHGKRLELAYWYGQSATGIGQTQATGSANVDTTHSKIRISDATWAVGIWSAEEGADLKVYKNSDNTAIVGSGGTGVFTITAVDTDNKTLTVSGVANDISALDTAVAAGACNLAFDYTVDGVNDRSASYFQEMIGIDYALSSASTVTLHNIPKSYSLWQASSYAVGGTLSYTRALAGVNKAVGKGGLSEKATLFVSVATWPNLAEQFVGAQIGAKPSSNAEAGVETIRYIGPNGSEIEVMPHSLIKDGEAFLIPLKRVVRGGAQEPSMEAAGQGQMFTWLPDNNGFEVRSYSDQFILITQPAKCVKFTGITNS